MNKDSENRRFFRIKETVFLKFQVIDEADFENGLEHWKNRSGEQPGIRSKVLDLDSRLDEIMYRVNNDAPAVADAIRLINIKLDTILEALPEFQQSKAALAEQPAQVCELNAEGIRFAVDETVALDTKVFLRFLLKSDNRYFETFGRVVRSTNAGEGQNAPKRPQIVVKFHGMNVAERETLIQHLFSQQSETLRSRRKKNASIG